MKYGELSPNSNINANIYRCLKVIRVEDQQKFVKKIQTGAIKDDQMSHLYRELLVGAYLQSKNMNVRYDQRILLKTPDWSIYDNSDKLIGIVEVTSINMDLKTMNYIDNQLSNNMTASYWRDGTKDNPRRLYQSIENKTTKYKEIINSLNIFFIVSVLISFKMNFHEDEIEEILYNKQSGIFIQYNHLSGVLIYYDSNDIYNFKYYVNKYSNNQIEVENGSM